MDYKKEIKNKGLKISWLAEKIGVSQPYLSMCLSGERNLGDEKEFKLKELLK
ncbi:hypothetical protein [uncultured Mediterranean phage uvMED]|nr:hypothetical protein [uncultured Mediterranean phage uvMED]